MASSVIETELASLVTIMITLLGIAIPLLPAATKLGQGNVFTGVCDSVHRRGLPQCMLRYHPLPPDQTPPGADTPPPLGPDPPGSRHTPLSRHPTPPWEQTPPEQTQPPRSRHPPPRSRPPPPGSRRHHTVNERPVRILLECILVFYFSLNWSFIDRRRPFCSDHVVKVLYSCDL